MAKTWERQLFKHFILELARNSDYLLDKISDRTVIDWKETLAEWNDNITKLIDEDVLTEEEAKELKYFVNEELEKGMSKDFYYNTLYTYHIISDKIDEPWYYFDLIMRYPYGATYFATEVMPIFTDIIKKEIEEA